MARYLAFLVLVTACTASPVTTTSDAVTTTTSTTAPSATTSPAEDLEPPQLPDPFDLAEEPLNGLEVDGFEFTDVEPRLVETVTLRLGTLNDLFSATVWEELASDGGDEVVAVSLYSSGSTRGDPSIAMAFGNAIGESGPDFSEAEERPVGDQTAYEVAEESITWVLWANNTHLFITLGEGDSDAPAAVMEAIIAKTVNTEYQWANGDCLFFDEGLPYAPFGEGNVVPCDGPHQWEVTSSEPLADPLDAPFAEEALGERVGASCEKSFFEFVGVLPIDSPLNRVFYLPDEAEWGEGDRYFACIISRSTSRGRAELMTGSLQGEASTVTRVEGDCYRRFIDVGKTDCEDPHVFEFIGLAAYPDDDATDYPGADELSTGFETACSELIEGYASDLTVEGATVSPFPAGISSFAWDQGIRAVPCYAYALDDGIALDVVGSFAEGWGPLGDADATIEV